ncbi:hypothetical protein NP233_g12985 [Leucocoprinus birnbaumii]|uniref:Uncharacterized protein n=1 Tax=Leucocoprinus birnbaumii TaxID=56174 RepID=A0AAD5YPI0_9AGAR|nr:hypothetical protein NP233_g12985 [Leucocoprinus birnbaumii]
MGRVSLTGATLFATTPLEQKIRPSAVCLPLLYPPAAHTSQATLASTSDPQDVVIQLDFSSLAIQVAEFAHSCLT